MAEDTKTARRDAILQAQSTVSTGFPFWDMMLSFGKTSQQMMTGYAARLENGPQSDRGAVHQTTSNVEVIPVGEETLNVGTRMVAGATTRVRRIVVETPVEQAVSLREERVIVERRKPTAMSATATHGILTETTMEMSDCFEVVKVWKSAQVTGEVVLRREVTQRHETVRDTVRRDEIVVEQAKPRVAAARHEVKTARYDQKIAPVPQANKLELAADLNEAAEQFEMSADQKEKAIATLHETLEPEKSGLEADRNRADSPARAQEAKVTAEPAKLIALPKRPEASATQSNKGTSGSKN